MHTNPNFPQPVAAPPVSEESSVRISTAAAFRHSHTALHKLVHTLTPQASSEARHHLRVLQFSFETQRDQHSGAAGCLHDVTPLTHANSDAEPRSKTLHRRARAVARNYLTETSRGDLALSPEQTQQALYDLRVHQVELELQAEELHATRRELDADILVHKELEDVLRASELRYRTVADFTSDWEYWILPDGSMRYVSPSCEQISGYTPAEFYADPDLLSRIVHADDQALFAQHRRSVRAAGEAGSVDFRIQTKDGHIRWIAHACRPVFDSDGKPNGVRASNRDNTERKGMEEQVRQLAFYDPLTRLANRTLLNDRLSQALLASKRSALYGALMFLDLDSFKALNDQHGHSAGDRLLTEVALRIQGCVREFDTVARFGGDEFVVMLDELALTPQEARSQAGTIAEDIRAVLAAPYLLGLGMGHDGVDAGTLEHLCTASIGVALFVYDRGATQNGILLHADTAMYQAKELGRNQVRFFEPPRAVASDNVDTDLPKALL